MRRQVWADYRADVADGVKMEFRLQQAEARDHQAAIRDGEVDGWEGMGTWVHVGLCFLTGGLWLPVLIWALWRDRRNYRDTSTGARDHQRRRLAKRELKDRRRARARGETTRASLDAPTVQLHRPIR